MSYFPTTTSLAMKLEGSYVASVVLTGLAVVFLALLLLILVFTIMGAVFNKKPKVKKLPNMETSEKTVKAENPTPIATSKVNTPVIEDGIDDEIVAVIAAAVAAMSAGSGKKLRLVSVSNGRSKRSAWAQAGIAENTRPF